MEGRILKGIGGFYYVQDGGGQVHECKACGRFRKENIKPLAGDNVVFSSQGGQQYGYIEEIQPRRNELTRPPVANVDLMLLVVSASKPHIDFMLCDKLLIQADSVNIPTVLCVNKADANKKPLDELEQQYQAYDILHVSAKDGSGLTELKEIICGKCVCLAGQSAVGKSSLINALDEKYTLEIGGLSKKTARGKHTTRTTELLYMEEVQAHIFDTPGFSMFEIKEMNPQGFDGYYKEFFQYAESCRFTSCRHENEPDCKVKQAVEDGRISPKRYERYLKLLKVVEDRHD